MEKISISCFIEDGRVMGDYDNIYNAGNKILKEVTKAVETGNYDNLSVSLKVSIEDAVRAAKANPSQNFRGKASTGRTVNYASGAKRIPFFTRKVSMNHGMGKVVGGIVGAAIFGLATLGAISTGVWAQAVTYLAITALFGILIKVGSDDKKLAKAFNKYGRILGNSEFFAVGDLAMAAGERSDTVLKNIKKMINKDFLPTARFDRNETTVMLSERAFAQYMRAEKARQDRELAEAQQMSQDRFSAESTEGVTNQGVKSIIDEGNAYLATIRRINDEIPGDEMSEKLYQLENIMRKIFTQVENEPECADELKKFMNYYLPTTTKLLNAYVDLDKQPEVGENITRTKKEIEGAIDVINDAFENLLDSLFQDMAWDISSDISVMKTMMAQDGLTPDGLMSGQPMPEPVPVPARTTPQPAPLSFEGSAYQVAPELQQAAGAQAQAAEDEKVQLKF
ncbi:5-bromo-4-chloroindolyl phosphate hydrolysis family protein [Butyrivibrio sp. WCD2001]|uniref:5-bromo-4-chloroindolyl phosphate hydrolysis family protein n=1 Tax=Butyrivibrio sp. WCD2001 TaxID=1280681 RepID=UPI00040F104B|nr:5-bromo-4-chloroindolyl phosphate hydrolysis family protein [Butyrivibrio sp. WCD2001]